MLMCPQAPMFGVTVGQPTIKDVYQVQDLHTSCNANCNCTIAYHPVCGDNNVTVKTDRFGQTDWNRQTVRPDTSGVRYGGLASSKIPERKKSAFKLFTFLYFVASWCRSTYKFFPIFLCSAS